MHSEIGPSSFSSKMKHLCTEYARSSYLQALHDLPTSSLPTFITGHSFTVTLTCRRQEPLAIPQASVLVEELFLFDPPFASFLLGGIRLHLLNSSSNTIVFMKPCVHLEGSTLHIQ